MADSGARVLVRRVRGPETIGVLLAVREDSLVLRTSLEPRIAVARDDIRDIKRSMGRSRGRGARQVFLGVAGVTMAVCWVVVGVAATAEGEAAGLLLAPAFCAPGALVFGAAAGAFGLLIQGDHWVPATVVEASAP